MVYTKEQHVLPGGLKVSTEEAAIEQSTELIQDWLLTFDASENPALINKARMVVAQLYSGLSSEELTVAEVYDDLCRDGYDNQGLSHTVVTMDLREDSKVAGTVRLVVGSDDRGNGLRALDAMNLVDADWPHRKMSLPDSVAGELGRFVVSESYRGKGVGLEVKVEVTSKLFQEAARVARMEHGITYLYAIMPHHVTRLTTEAGIESIMVPSTLRDGDEANVLVGKYDRYWGLKPNLYQFIIE